MKKVNEFFSFKCEHCGGTKWRGRLENAKPWKDTGMVTKRFYCEKCWKKVSDEQANILSGMTDEEGRLKSEYQTDIPAKKNGISLWVILIVFMAIGFFIGRSVNMISVLEAERQEIESELIKNAEEISEIQRLKVLRKINHNKIDSLTQILKAGKLVE